MKFSDVKENTWIHYKENVYYVSQVHHDYIDAMSLHYETIEIPDVAFLTNNIELVELQNHNVGDMVLYVGTHQDMPQTVEIIEYSTGFPLQYYVQTLDKEMSTWTTAFDITSINY